MTRRTILLFVLAMSALPAAYVWLLPRAQPAARDSSLHRVPPEWRELPDDLKPYGADALREQTGIILRSAVVAFTAPGGSVTGTAPTPEEVRAAALVVVTELQRYPPAYLRETQLETVILAHSIRGAGRSLGGLASPPNRALLMSTERTSDYWRHELHHELFHLFDRGTLDDEQWSAMNPAGFRYDPALGRVADVGEAFGINSTLFGFVSRYSMSAPREDRAELFAGLVTDYPSVMEVAAHDRHVAAKVRWLEDAVARRVPEMGPQFWEGAR